MYLRVIPRDLFNESKLLKCLGQLSLLIHDCRFPQSLTIEHDAGEDETDGFTIVFDGYNNVLYCTNIFVYSHGEPITIYTPYNSKDVYPLEFTDENAGENYRVFDETGSPSAEFLYHIQRTPVTTNEEE